MIEWISNSTVLIQAVIIVAWTVAVVPNCPLSIRRTALLSCNLFSVLQLEVSFSNYSLKVQSELFQNSVCYFSCWNHFRGFWLLLRGLCGVTLSCLSNFSSHQIYVYLDSFFLSRNIGYFIDRLLSVEVLYMLSHYLYILTLEVNNVLILTFPGIPFLISLTRWKSPFRISLKIIYLFVVFIKCCNFLFLLFVSMFFYKGDSIQYSVVSQCLA